MSEIFLSLEEAAELEDSTYDSIKKRIQRNKDRYITKREKNLNGGKESTWVSLESLSPKARRLYKRRNPSENQLMLVEESTEDKVPWYVNVSLNWFKYEHSKKWDKAIVVANEVKAFLEYSEEDRTTFATEFAEEMGISQRTLYRYAESYIEAEKWEIQLRRETGFNHEHLKILAMCRKPKEENKFPSLNNEQKAFIENVWFNQGFSANHGTVEMLYTQFKRYCIENKMEYPSVKTVGRYINYFMEERNLKGAKDLVTNGEREWKRNTMVKALRNTAAVPVLGIVQGDSHTLDFWVQYRDPNNGKISAIRPTMVAWIDTRSRVVMGTVWAKNVNAQTVKQSVVKFVYEYGVPKCILIDNGKDYTANEMLGRKRNERNKLLVLDKDSQGFYKSMGILDDYRALPYQPWAKGPIERFFGTVCEQFSKWFGSYTGTLTGSKTSSKIKKNVDKLLEEGKLLTIEEAYQIWIYWLDNEYHQNKHSGLKRMNERFTTPMSLFENAEERIQLPPPPMELAEMLLMKCKQSRVSPIGIKLHGQIYMNYALTEYIHDKVNVRWNPEDMSKIYVYDYKNRKICDAECKALLEYNGLITEKNLQDHLKDQKKQLAADKAKLEYATTPYELRGYEGDALITGKLELVIERKVTETIECKAEAKSNVDKIPTSEYFESIAKADLRKLQKIKKED